MPIPQYLYLNAPTLSQATAVFYDAALTLCAADGYYSDGTVVRQQVGCVLLPVESCSDCGLPCSSIGGVDTSTSGSNIFILNADTGTTSSDVGAIIVRFNAPGTVSGIIATFNSITHSRVSSENYGYLAGTTGLPIFVGPASGDCGIAGSTYTLPEYAYDGTSYVSIGTTDTFSVLAVGQVQTTATAPGWCTMVIPKLTPTPSAINVTIYSPCPDSLTELEIFCPELLKQFTASSVQEEILDSFCDLPTTTPYYVANVNGSGSYLGLYDMVFYDAYGQYPMNDGYYKTNYLSSPMDTIQVQNGVIIAITNNCP